MDAEEHALPGAHAEVEIGIVLPIDPISMTTNPFEAVLTKDVVNTAVRNSGPLPKLVKI